jgi:hypothetical protein
LKAQIADYTVIANRYAAATPVQQKQIRDWAREVKLSAGGDGPDWIQELGEIVDGNDAMKTKQFAGLRKNLDDLK